ncbi:MAG: hypothetical protein M1161_03180 [Candidatus Thermoplasmatota archaeon]|nr:hypothetical protein [Candidatus Thermoplasmatota archaeon]
MNEPLSRSIDARARVISSYQNGVAIYRENPLYEYFSRDQRADAVLIRDGSVIHIGESEIEEGFSSFGDSDSCIASPHYEFRKGKTCTPGTDTWFEYPLFEEQKVIQEERKSLNEIVDSIVSEMTVEDTELTLAQSIKKQVCGSGYALYYEPITAFDENTLKVWNKPEGKSLKKVMYVEIAAKKRGLTALYSNSFLVSGEEKYIEKYRRNIEAIELLKKNFVEGKSTSELSKILEEFRNPKLYLTTPLYPFNYTPIPGDEKRIRTRNLAVFDIWNLSSDFSFRRKVTAISGNYRATVI